VIPWDKGTALEKDEAVIVNRFSASPTGRQKPKPKKGGMILYSPRVTDWLINKPIFSLF
jgi:hypothetical protein